MPTPSNFDAQNRDSVKSYACKPRWCCRDTGKVYNLGGKIYMAIHLLAPGLPGVGRSCSAFAVNKALVWGLVLSPRRPKSRSSLGGSTVAECRVEKGFWICWGRCSQFVRARGGRDVMVRLPLYRGASLASAASFRGLTYGK